jgi:hypothetical protein
MQTKIIDLNNPDTERFADIGTSIFAPYSGLQPARDDF